MFNFVASYRAQDANIINPFISFYMVYSKRVTDLQQIYQLPPDDVFFCMLVASGASRGEAYATIFRPRSTKIETAQRGAAQLAKDKPVLISLYDLLKITARPSFLTMIAPKARRKRKTQKQKRKKKPGMLYNTEIKMRFYQVSNKLCLI